MLGSIQICSCDSEEKALPYRVGGDKCSVHSPADVMSEGLPRTLELNQLYQNQGGMDQNADQEIQPRLSYASSEMDSLKDSLQLIEAIN